MSSLLDLAGRVSTDVVRTFAGTWPYLLLSIVAAAALTGLVPTVRLAAILRRRTPHAVVGAVGLASATPFCSCGTTAVVLGMLASSVPWAPIVAFLVSSPLTSPSELLLSAGLLGWPFAWTFFVGTILLGLVAGAVTAAVERTGWLAGQARTTVDCGAACPTPTGDGGALSPGPGAAAVGTVGADRPRRVVRTLGRQTWVLGRRLLVQYAAFTALGYLVIEAVPTAWLQSLLGGDSALAVVSAALLGIPMYVNTEGSLPLVAGFVAQGMSPGAALAFLVTGAGTSVGAVAGMLVIARRRVVALTVGLLVLGAIVLGLATDLVMG